MIPQAEKHSVSSTGVVASGAFGISGKDTHFVMKILRSQIYTDKVMAVLREYSANAWDANHEVGRGDVPIEVHLPTDDDLILRIADNGPGLSQTDIFEVFAQYGASTKRNSNTAVGMLGIGSKSAFSYTDSFTIVSCHGGTKSTYVAAIDATEKGLVNLLHEEPCGDKTGLEIQVAVASHDVGTFAQKARTLYVHFTPPPIINLSLPDTWVGVLEFPSGIVYEPKAHHPNNYAGVWTAVMGCVPYRIDVRQMPNLPACVSRLGGVLRFPIGAVQVSASREELSYVDATKAAIQDRIDTVVTDYIKHVTAQLDAETTTPWQKRLRVLEILNQVNLKLALPKRYAGFTEHSIEIDVKDAKTFNARLGSGKENVDTIRIKMEADTRIVLRDDNRGMRGYKSALRYTNIMIVPKRGVLPTDARKELDDLIEKLLMTGVQIVNISTLNWVGSSRDNSDVDRNKHRVRSFRLGSLRGHPYSENWEAVKREPTPDDVFVLICGFKSAEMNFNIYERHRINTRIAKAIVPDMVLPEIYGYKTSATKPISRDSIIGTHYIEWEKQFFEKLRTPAVIKLWDSMHWAYIADRFDIGAGWRKEDPKRSKRCNETLERLGPAHPITQFVNDCVAAANATKSMGGDMRDAVDSVGKFLGLPDVAETHTKTIHDAYPLIGLQGESFGVLWEDKSHALWAEYVQLIDMQKRINTALKETP